jgi:hypothetical protein
VQGCRPMDVGGRCCSPWRGGQRRGRKMFKRKGTESPPRKSRCGHIHRFQSYVAKQEQLVEVSTTFQVPQLTFIRIKMSKFGGINHQTLEFDGWIRCLSVAFSCDWRFRDPIVDVIANASVAIVRCVCKEALSPLPFQSKKSSSTRSE